MQNRTFLRTMLDLLLNNAVINTLTAIVNFCNEQQRFGRQKLKFSKKMPINNIEIESYDNRFLFNGKLKVENGK